MTAPTRKPPSVLPFIGFAAVAVLALVSLYVEDPSGAGLTERIYRSIGIFTANGAWAFETTDHQPHANMLFRILAIIAPVMTALGLTELATGGTVPLWHRATALVQRQVRPAAAIIGLTEDSLAFASSLRASGQEVPLIYASDPDAALAARATQRRLAVLPLRRRAVRLMPRRVEHVVSFLPSAGQQVDVLASLRARRNQYLCVSLLMPDRGLAARLDEYLKFTAIHQGVHPHLIDQDALAARLLLARHPLDTLADAFGQDRIHIAIYGCGALGRAVAKQAARYYVTRHALDGRKIRITIIDQVADPLRSILAEAPGMATAAELQAIGSAALDPAGFTDADVLRLVPADVTAHVMAMGDAQAAFALAISLRRWLLEPPEGAADDWQATHPLAPIFVRATEWTGLGRVLRSGVDCPPPAPPEMPDGLFAFATREEVLNRTTLLAHTRQRGGKANHDAYSPPPEGATQRPAQKPWTELVSGFRESDMQAADHIAVKARMGGYRLDAEGGKPPGKWPPPEPTMRDLSHLEHLRYLAERGADGWRHAPVRVDAMRVHHDLVPFDALPAAERGIDRQFVAALPNVAAAMGLRLAPAFVIGAVPGPAPHSPDDWHDRLVHLAYTHPDHSPVLLTTLAPGSPLNAALAAERCGLPWIVILPLPYELYKDDFPGEALTDFQRLAGLAEYYLELPLQARASALAYHHRTRAETDPGNAARRAAQMAAADAYIRRHATGALPFAGNWRHNTIMG